MAGKKKVLSPGQSTLLADVRQKYERRLVEQGLIKRRHAEAVKREMEALDLALALAVRRAFEAGVPISHIGSDGMNTSAPGTPRDWLRRTDALAALEADSTGSMFESIDGEAVRVRIPMFPTTAISPQDYPEVLEGVARLSPTGWIVVEDPGTKVTDHGELPGWFTWELERPNDTPDSLPAMLNAWAEANG